MSWNLVKNFKHDETNGLFGTSVCVYGNYIIVGARGDKKAYIYERNNKGEWLEIQEFHKPNISKFGFRVSMYENYAVIGSEDGGNIVGYRRKNDGVWVEMISKQEGNKFGHDVSVYGNRIAVGSPENNSGSVTIYERIRGIWVEKNKIHVNDKNYGFSVFLYGNYLFVGSPGNNSGNVYFYQKGLKGWEMRQKIHHNVKNFGWDISVYKNYTIFGTKGSSKTFWYLRDCMTGLWNKLKEINEEGESEFGRSVSIYGNLSIVGDTSSGIEKAFWYKKDNRGNTVAMINSETNPIQGSSDFGDSVSIYGNYAVVGGDGSKPPHKGGISIYEYY